MTQSCGFEQGATTLARFVHTPKRGLQVNAEPPNGGMRLGSNPNQYFSTLVGAQEPGAALGAKEETRDPIYSIALAGCTDKYLLEFEQTNCLGGTAAALMHVNNHRPFLLPHIAGRCQELVNGREGGHPFPAPCLRHRANDSTSGWSSQLG